jgi:type IV secretory pathway VirJ component
MIRFVISVKPDVFMVKKFVLIIIACMALNVGRANDYNVQDPKLPVVITRAKFENKDQPFVILISGDGGWYGFEQTMADLFAATGIPTVGLNARRYFWNRRTPEETTADMVSLINFYRKEFGKNKYILIGYSQGAEIFPFVINLLPPNIKSGIVSAVLLSPQMTTDFEVHLTNMMGIGNPQNKYKVPDEIAKIRDIQTLCIFGEGEKSQLPALLANTQIKISIVPGDHHYKNDIALIIRTIKANGAL